MCAVEVENPGGCFALLGKVIDVHAGPAGPACAQYLIQLCLYIRGGWGCEGVVLGDDGAAGFTIEECFDRLHIRSTASSPDEVAFSFGQRAGEAFTALVHPVGVGNVEQVGLLIQGRKVPDWVIFSRMVA